MRVMNNLKGTVLKGITTAMMISLHSSVASLWYWKEKEAVHAARVCAGF